MQDMEQAMTKGEEVGAEEVERTRSRLVSNMNGHSCLIVYPYHA